MPTPVLQYAPPTETVVVRHRRPWAWLALAIPSAVAPFVPFACDATPVGAAVSWVGDHGTDRWHADALVLTSLAVGLILGLFITLWRLRLMIRRPIGTGERLGVAAVSGTVSLGFILAMTVLIVSSSLRAGEWAAVGAGVLTFVSAGWSVWLLGRRSDARPRTLVMLLVPYLATSAFCLIEFWDDRRIGWYLTLVSAPAATVEVLLLTLQHVRGQRVLTLAQQTDPALVEAPGPEFVH